MSSLNRNPSSVCFYMTPTTLESMFNNSYPDAFQTTRHCYFFSVRLEESIINGNDKTKPRNNTSCLLEEALLQACLYGTALLPAREVFGQELTGLSLVVGSGKVKTKALWVQSLEPLFTFKCESTKGLKHRLGRRVEGTGCLGFPHEWHNW